MADLNLSESEMERIKLVAAVLANPSLRKLIESQQTCVTESDAYELTIAEVRAIGELLRLLADCLDSACDRPVPPEVWDGTEPKGT